MKKLLLLFFLVPLTLFAEAEPLFNILNDGSGSGTSPRACQLGDSPTSRNGLIGFSFRDSSGNLVLPQQDSASRIRTASATQDGAGTAITSHATDTATTQSLDVDVRHSALPDGASTATNQNTTNTRIGDLTETAPSTDTASSGLNGRIQRIAQRLTTLIAFYASNFGADSAGIRVNAQVGNSTGAAAFNSGATSAQTLRTASNLYDASANALTTRSYASVRPLDVYMPQIGSSSVTHTRTTLTANTSTQIAATNTNRKWLYISNQSGATVYIKFGVTAVINQGIEISNNTIWKMSAVELYLGIINVIVGSNNRTIEIIEAS